MSDQRYDVFISYRGMDTRYGFTGNLWKALHDKGIHTFMDDQILGKGEAISPLLFKAIENSRTAIIVLSKNYASSTFCLDELSKILDCMKEKDMLVWPVFYDVDPSSVRHHRGAYGEAFAKHKEKFKDDMEKVHEWRVALSTVSNLSGWDFTHRDQYEFQFISKIVEDVSNKLDRIPLLNMDYVVGIESRLQEVLSLLELESGSDGVLTVGIYGTTGIGKTTLARQIYNMIAEKFEASCFLPQVRENSSIHGLVHLQNMLLSEMIGEKDSNLTNVDRGALRIKNRLHLKKVLLIIDDVDTLEQVEALAGKLDWFGPGSRVIVTTQDKHLLAFHEVERTYDVQPLNHIDALELLSHQVFKQGNVDPAYTEILNELVSYASGLPLALKVVGSRLFGKSVEEWKNALHRFKRIPPNEIQKTLKTSFDALREDEKGVFLDIACCFQGYELSTVLDILRAHHGDYVKLHIDVLIDKSLISVNSDGKVTLHPLIEDMGKEVVRQEYPKELGKRTRLWFPEDIVHVLKNNMGTSNIEIIHMDSPIEDEEEIEWDGEAFKKMENLKTLIIRKGKFSKAPKYIPDSLRVLEWWRYPSEELPSDFNSNQLTICKLPHIMSPEMAELPEGVHTSMSVSQFLQILQRVYENKMWRIVGLMSSIVGLSCFALSPSFNRLIRGWKAWKFFLYGMFSLVVLTAVLFVHQSSFFARFVRYKITAFVVLILMAVYTYYYDKALNGEPEILSLVSNAAFALLSLSLSKLIKYERAMSIFSFSLGYLVVQLWTINWKLILVAIFFGSPLFYLHSSSDPRHSSTDLKHSSSNRRHSSSDFRHSSSDLEHSSSYPIHSSSDSIQDHLVLDIEAS